MSEEKTLEKKKKHSKKFYILLAIICFIISSIGVGICGSILVGMIRYDVFSMSKEANKKDFQDILQQRYAVMALSGANDDYHMDEIKKTNLHMGIYKSKTENIDESVLKDPKNYEVHNFDKNFDFSKAQVFTSYINENTSFQYDMHNIFGSAYVEHMGEVHESSQVSIDGYYYDWMNDTLYFLCEDVLYPYVGDVMREGYDEGEDTEEDYKKYRINEKDLNEEKTEWLNPNMTVYLPEFNQKIMVGNIEILDDFSLKNFNINNVGFVIDNIADGYLYFTGSPYATEDNQTYYWVVSYLNDPLVFDGTSYNSTDLFIQAEYYFDLFYGIRYPMIVLMIVLCVVMAISGLFIFIFGICALIKKMFRKGVQTVGKVRVLWRVAILLVGYMLFRVFLFWIIGFSRAVVFLSVCEIIFLVIPIVTYFVWQLRDLASVGEELAKGNLNTNVETKNMIWEIKKHGENLNSISDNIQLAVEERMKSERMKTELITNVSHDIKTPLTSIINYVDLLSKEELQDPKQREYLEVLTRQSEKLKKLIEDLIEASKATTGNLDIHKMQCDPKVLLQQALGEYETKFAEKSIEVVATIPESISSIFVDGKYLWRIFENLFVNIYKYALPGTRAYVELEEKEERIHFVFKNVSKEALNISVDELTERFVRGDSSRNTEGNGLGLAIVRSLAENMDGEVEISIDGDLFKVQVSFPKVSIQNKEMDKEE